MLEFLRGKASDRKLRLFACECYRHAYPQPDEYKQAALEAIELHLEGRLSRKKARASTIHPLDHFFPLFHDHVNTDSFRSMVLILAGANGRYDPDNLIRFREERGSQCEVLRDIFGSLPFYTVFLDPAWLTWQGGLVVSMAKTMYDSRDFTDMPILADALEDAGCSDPDILGHCRSGDEHVRGCWVIDLLLGK
jgi:hypothetical protein